MKTEKKTKTGKKKRGVSASNPAICPQCEVNHEADIIRRTKDLEDSYGKIPAEEYLSGLEALRAHEKNGPSASAGILREDYEIGVLYGELHINYRASCNVCGFIYEHKDERRLTTKKEKTEKPVKLQEIA